MRRKAWGACLHDLFLPHFLSCVLSQGVSDMTPLLDPHVGNLLWGSSSGSGARPYLDTQGPSLAGKQCSHWVPLSLRCPGEGGSSGEPMVRACWPGSISIHPIIRVMSTFLPDPSLPSPRFLAQCNKLFLKRGFPNGLYACEVVNRHYWSLPGLLPLPFSICLVS